MRVETEASLLDPPLDITTPTAPIVVLPARRRKAQNARLLFCNSCAYCGHH
jgi:hypothetical protein